MDIDEYLKRLKEESRDSEREEDVEATAKAIEELVAIPRCLQIFIEFSKDKLRINNLSTNIHKPKDKVNVSMMEYDIGPLGIESNAYIIDEGTKNLTKLV